MTAQLALGVAFRVSVLMTKQIGSREHSHASKPENACHCELRTRVHFQAPDEEDR